MPAGQYFTPRPLIRAMMEVMRPRPGETVRRRLLQDFIKCYNAKNRHDRLEVERFRAFRYEDFVKRDKASLDIFWLKDESLEDSDNLPYPAILAREIVASLETALEQFRGIEDELKD